MRLNTQFTTDAGSDSAWSDADDVTGDADAGSTPNVQYAYSEMSGVANHSRPTSMTYPDGDVVNDNYSSRLNDTISRLSSLPDARKKCSDTIYRLFVIAVAVAPGCGPRVYVTTKAVDIGEMKIKAVHARLFANDYLAQHDTDEVEVPAKYYRLITKLLSKPIRDEYFNPKIAAEACRIRITDIDGHEIRVKVWYDYKRKILFSLEDGTPMTRDGPYEEVEGKYVSESAALSGLIKSIIESDEDKQRQFQDGLWRSVGVSP